jgi:hypothetical protein
MPEPRKPRKLSTVGAGTYVRLVEPTPSGVFTLGMVWPLDRIDGQISLRIDGQTLPYPRNTLVSVVA